MIIYAYVIAPSYTIMTPNPSLIKYSMIIFAYVIAPSYTFITANPSPH